MKDLDFFRAMRIEPCSLPEPIPHEWTEHDKRATTDDEVINAAVARASHAAHMLDIAADAIERQAEQGKTEKWRIYAAFWFSVALAWFGVAIWLAKR